MQANAGPAAWGNGHPVRHVARTAQAVLDKFSNADFH
jgi:hypothetical protein